MATYIENKKIAKDWCKKHNYEFVSLPEDTMIIKFIDTAFKQDNPCYIDSHTCFNDCLRHEQQNKKNIISFDEKMIEAQLHVGYANSYLRLAIKRLNKLAVDDAAELTTKVETSIDEMTKMIKMIKKLRSIGNAL